MTIKERRQYVRQTVNIPVEFMVAGYFYQGWIRNISEGGVFIETKELFTVGQVISMTYSSADYKEENRAGEIVRVAHQGVGVKFNVSG